MTTMPEDLRTFINADAAVAALIVNRTHYNRMPESSVRPNIWFRVTSDTEPLTMDGVGGIHEATADIECAGLTETSAQAVADALKPRLHGYKGTMGNISAKAIFLSDKDDDYVPFSNESNEGVHVIAFGARIWYST